MLDLEKPMRLRYHPDMLEHLQGREFFPLPKEEQTLPNFIYGTPRGIKKLIPVSEDMLENIPEVKRREVWLHCNKDDTGALYVDEVFHTYEDAMCDPRSHIFVISVTLCLLDGKEAWAETQSE